MKNLLIFLLLARSLSVAAGQTGVTVTPVIMFANGVYMSGLCQDTMGVIDVSTHSPWASECAKKYIDRRDRDTAAALRAAMSSAARAALSVVTTNATPAYNAATGVISIPATSTRRDTSYTGTTNGAGLFNITFPVAYAATPSIQANIIGGTDQYQCRVISISTTAFSVLVYQRVSVLTLALSIATTPVSGATVDVLIVRR